MPIFHLPEKPLRQINSFRRELSFEYLFVFCKIWGILTCFWLIWLSKSHFSFARKTLEANQFLSSRAFVWVPICILQNLRHFDMFLTCLILKMSFFICQKNPWLRFLLMSNGNPMTNENDYIECTWQWRKFSFHHLWLEIFHSF